jgi:hypothetical protein
MPASCSEPAAAEDEAEEAGAVNATPKDAALVGDGGGGALAAAIAASALTLAFTPPSPDTSAAAQDEERGTNEADGERGEVNRASDPFSLCFCD